MVSVRQSYFFVIFRADVQTSIASFSETEFPIKFHIFLTIDSLGRCKHANRVKTAKFALPSREFPVKFGDNFCQGAIALVYTSVLGNTHVIRIYFRH